MLPTITMTSEPQLENLQKQLSQLYLGISDSYKRMSKAKDLYSRQIIQSGIDINLKQAHELSDKIEVIKKDVMTQWNETMVGKPNKSQYD